MHNVTLFETILWFWRVCLSLVMMKRVSDWDLTSKNWSASVSPEISSQSKVVCRTGDWSCSLTWWTLLRVTWLLCPHLPQHSCLQHQLSDHLWSSLCLQSNSIWSLSGRQKGVWKFIKFFDWLRHERKQFQSFQCNTPWILWSMKLNWRRIATTNILLLSIWWCGHRIAVWPESDGAGAEADVVRGGGSGDSTWLRATLPPPAAPVVSVTSLPLGDCLRVVVDLGSLTVPGRNVELRQRLANNEEWTETYSSWCISPVIPWAGEEWGQCWYPEPDNHDSCYIDNKNYLDYTHWVLERTWLF